MNNFPLSDSLLSALIGLAGVVLGFLLSFLATFIQRRIDWNRAKKLKRHDAIVNFIINEAADYSDYRHAYERKISNKSLHSLDTMALAGLLELRIVYFEKQIVNLSVLNVILNDPASIKKSKEFSETLEEKIENIEKIIDHEVDTVSSYGGRATGNLHRIAQMDHDMNQISRLKNEFIAQSLEKIE